MVNTQLLVDTIQKNGYSKNSFAHAIGLSPKTFKKRLIDGNFGVVQVSKIYDILNLPTYNDIFIFD